jgi:plastocyanin
MTRTLAVVALAGALLLAVLTSAAAPAPAAAGSLSLRISPTGLSPLGTATLSGTVSPKLKRPGKLLVQFSSDGKQFVTIKTLSLPKGATKYKTTFTAGTLLGPAFLRARFGALSTKGLRIMVTETVDVTIADFAFSPKVVTVKPWTTVLWTNGDPGDHTVTSVDSLDLNATPTGLFDSGPIAAGHTFGYTFSTPGTYYYECRIHSGDAAMHAQVIVEQSAARALAPAD